MQLPSRFFDISTFNFGLMDKIISMFDQNTHFASEYTWFAKICKINREKQLFYQAYYRFTIVVIAFTVIFFGIKSSIQHARIGADIQRGLLSTFINTWINSVTTREWMQEMVSTVLLISSTDGGKCIPNVLMVIICSFEQSFWKYSTHMFSIFTWSVALQVVMGVEFSFFKLAFVTCLSWVSQMVYSTCLCFFPSWDMLLSQQIQHWR